ncbi:MAG: dihydroorotase, partial [Oscillospiraceae bacterium]
DHAPHTKEEKSNFLTAPNGVVGLETSLAVTLTQLYHNGKSSLGKIAELMSINPRKILGIAPERIAEGCNCNLTIFDPDSEWEVIPAELHSKSKNSVFKGEKLKGRVCYTISNGKIIFEL